MAISASITNSCRSCDAKCCRGLAVVLTIPEALRLQQALSKPPGDFLELSGCVDSRKTPHFPIFSTEGRQVREFFIIIKKQPGGDCIFLNADKTCKIYPHRPFVCRLYPFELTDCKRQKKGALCPINFIREPQTDSEAESLEADLKLHGTMARRWNVEKGKIGQIGEMLDYFAALRCP